VTQIVAQGALVKMDKAADGLLILPQDVKDAFRIGDNVHGMKVEKVDRRKDVLVLSLADPELAVVPKRRLANPEFEVVPNGGVGFLSTQRLVQVPRARSPPRSKDKEMSRHNTSSFPLSHMGSTSRSPQFPTKRAAKMFSPQTMTTVHRSLSRDKAEVISSQNAPSSASTVRVSGARSQQFPVWGEQRETSPQILD